MRILPVLLACLVQSTSTLATSPVAHSFAPMAMPNVQTPIAFPQRTNSAPVIDGKLDDACWKEAVKIGELRNNMTSEPALEQTTVWMCYDRRTLYIAVDAVEEQMEHLGGRPQGDKEDVWSGDVMEFFIAPHGDGKTYYQFCVGAKFGQRYDARNDLGRTYHNKHWQSAVHLDKDAGRFTMELSIPFSAFEMDGPPKGSLWNFNACRNNVNTVPPATEFGRHGADNSKELTQWSPTGASFHTLSKFGRLFFGSAEALAERREPMNVELVLDRYAYDRLDTNGVGVLATKTGGRDMSDISAMLTLVKGKDVQGVKHNIAVNAPFTSFQLPVADLEPGQYKLIATLIAQDAAPATATWDFAVTDYGLAPGVNRSGRIPLKLPPRDDDKRSLAWPVRTGVPFPQGALDDPNKVRLLVNGQPAPCQTSVRATWGPGASIRWLGLSFIAQDPDATYELEYGGASAPQPAQPVSATAKNNTATVNTGPLQFTVTKAGLVSATLNGKRAVNGNDQTSPYLVDESGTIYRTALSDDVTVEVEEAGPIQAVVRVTGWFASDKGNKLCKFTTYYEAFAGLPHVFVDHAVVITYDTTTNKLRDLGFPVAAAGNRYAFGVHGGPAVTGSRAKRTYAVQDRYNHFIARGEQSVEGEKLAGWADAGSDNLGVTLTGQYTWQRYPLEFSVDNQKLTYHLWPADLGNTFTDEEELDRSEIYKLLSAHEGPALDLNMPRKYFDKVFEYGQNENVYLIYAKKGLESNGQGVAINEPFIITFRDKPLDSDSADTFARLSEQNPHAIADPKWTSLTQAMGPIAAVDRENYPHIARFAGPAFLAMTWPAVQDAKDYGKFNFGDVHTYFTPYLDPPRVGLHRVWLNHHYSQNDLPWWLYAFYGEHKYLDWARVSSHHTMNVDIVHYEDPENPLPFHKLGAIYHVKGFIHWGYDTQLTGHNAWSTYLNWNWFMTGNRRARDVGNEWVTGVINAQPSGAKGREGQNALGHLTNFYQHRFDPRLLWVLENFATTVKSEPLAKQAATYWNPATFYMYDMFRHDPQMLEMLRVPEYRIERYRDHKLHLTAYFYLKTGDKKYLEPINDLYEKLGVQFDEPGHPYDGFNKYRFLQTGLLIHQLLVIQKAFNQAGIRVRPEERLPRPALVEHGRYTRASPQQYTLGVMKTNNQAITIDTGDDAELAKAITIIAPSGETIKAINANASLGLYEVHVKAGKPINVRGAEPFFLVRKGQPAGLIGHTLTTIAPLEGDGPIHLQFETGDKAPTRLAIIDAQGNEVASASSWVRYERKRKSLTVPAGGPWRIIAPYPATIWPDRDIKLTPIRHSPTKAK